MKIIVKNLGGGFYWQWSIVNENNKTVAVGYKYYSRKSDAKRGAGRFEQKLWMFYQNVEDDGQGIPIEVLD